MLKQGTVEFYIEENAKIRYGFILFKKQKLGTTATLTYLKR